MGYADVNILLQKIILQREAFAYFLAMFLVMPKLKISKTVKSLLKQI